MRKVMYVCICKNLTEGQIRKAVHDGDVSSVRDLRIALGACDQCGKCVREAREIIKGAASAKSISDHRTAIAS